MVFHPIKIEDRNKLIPYLSCSKLIDMGFCSLYSIKNSFFPEYTLYKDMLILRMKYGEQTAYAHPLSSRKITHSDIEDFLQYFDEKKIIIDYIPEDEAEIYSNISGYKTDIISFDKYSDYFSFSKDFTDKNRSGHPRKYTDLRSFITHYEPKIQTICKNNIDDCRLLFDRWCFGRNCSLCAYGCEKKLQNVLFDEWEFLPCKGIIVYTDGEPQGYLIGEENGETALILYGKPAGRQNGLNVYMHIMLIEQCFPHAKYVNFSPDSGMDGLRAFKNKFTPYIKIKKYYCELTKI